MLFITVYNDLFQTESLKIIKEFALVVNSGCGCIINCNFGSTLHSAYVYAEFVVKIRIVCNGGVCAVKHISGYNVVNNLLDRINRRCVELFFYKCIKTIRAEVAVIKEEKIRFLVFLCTNSTFSCSA